MPVFCSKCACTPQSCTWSPVTSCVHTSRRNKENCTTPVVLTKLSSCFKTTYQAENHRVVVGASLNRKGLVKNETSSARAPSWLYSFIRASILPWICLAEQPTGAISVTAGLRCRPECSISCVWQELISVNGVNAAQKLGPWMLREC